MSRGRASLFAALATAVAALWCAMLFSAGLGGGSARSNVRVERTERFGSDAFGTRHATVGDDHALALDASGHAVARATWDVGIYEFRHLLPRARTCRPTLYATGLDTFSTAKRASLIVRFDGRIVRAVRFSAASAASFPFAYGLGVPQGLAVRELALSPLDRTYAIEIPLSPSECAAPDWRLGVEVRNAHWSVLRVGVIATFEPNDVPLLGSFAVDAAIAVLEIAALCFAAFSLLRSLLARDSGISYVVPALGALALAPLTHDQWDFAIWPRFVDLVAFGHANPAGMWQGTPLWAFLPALLAPVATASGAYFGNLSQDSIAVILKETMALAVVFAAASVSQAAPSGLRRATYLIVILSPIALYQLGGGYREALAGACVAEGIRRAYRGQPSLATIACVAAASITESLAAFVFLGSAFAAIDRTVPKYRLARAAALATLAVAAVATQWAFLIPHDLATSGISSRIYSYRFGGASWYGALATFGVLPAWIADRSLAAMVAVFVALAPWPAISAIRTIVADLPPAIARERMHRAILCITIAFFLSYRGVDPNTWYALFIVLAAFFARYDPLSPFPLLLGCVQGLVFYAILGLGDFVNWTFLYPRDRGLLGILGTPVNTFVLCANALVLAGYVALGRPTTALLFGPRSTTFVVLFVSAVAEASIRAYPEDVAFVLSASAMAVVTFARLHAASRDRAPARPITTAALVLTIVVGAAIPSVGAPARLALLAGAMLAVTSGIGFADAILILGADAIAASQPGFGWISIVGWIGLSLLAATAVGAIVDGGGSERRDDRRLHEERRELA